MRILIHLIYLIFFSVTLSSCWNNKWTEKELEEFRKKCEQQINFEPGPISFTGFEFEELKTVLIIEKNGTQVIDSLQLNVNDYRSHYDKAYKKHWATPEVKFNINYSYEFIINGSQPYILDNMEMIVWAQPTMTSDGYGCVMGNFTIDNVKFEYVGNINITKRGFVFE